MDQLAQLLVPDDAKLKRIFWPVFLVKHVPISLIASVILEAAKTVICAEAVEASAQRKIIRWARVAFINSAAIFDGNGDGIKLFFICVLPDPCCPSRSATTLRVTACIST